MPNQRDPSKKLIGGYVTDDLKQKLDLLGVEQATAVEMLLVESMMRHKHLRKQEVEGWIADGKLRPGTVLWLRSKGLINDPFSSTSVK